MKVFSKRRRAAAALAASFLALSLAACASDSDGETATAGDDGLVKVTIGGTTPTMTYSPILTMLEYDLDAKHGLDVNFEGSGTTGSVVVSGMLSNQYPLGFAASQSTLDAVSQGADLKLVTSTFTQGNTMVVNKDVAADLAPVTATSPIGDRIDALRGLTIATSQPGSGVNLLLRSILTENGLDPDKDVKIIGVAEPSAMVAGLGQGRFDAAIFGTGVIEAAIANGTGDLWFSVAADDVGPIKNTRGLSLFGRPDYVEGNTKTVDNLRAALMDAAEKIAADPDEVSVRLKEKYFPDLDQKIWDLSWKNILPAFPTDGTFPESSFDAFNQLAPEPYTMSYEDLVYGPAQAK
jgi:NitT/TauT family transport system substrate-binding protein